MSPLMPNLEAHKNGNLAAEAMIAGSSDGHTFLVAQTAVESINPFIFQSSQTACSVCIRRPEHRRKSSSGSTRRSTGFSPSLP